MGFPLSGWTEDTTVIFFFVLVTVCVFTGSSSSYADNPLVWGFATFLGVVFGSIGALASSGLGLLVPIAFIVMLFYFQTLTHFLGEGPVAWILCAFVIMLLASGGYA